MATGNNAFNALIVGGAIGLTFLTLGIFQSRAEADEILERQMIAQFQQVYADLRAPENQPRALRSAGGLIQADLLNFVGERRLQARLR